MKGRIVEAPWYSFPYAVNSWINKQIMILLWNSR